MKIKLARKGGCWQMDWDWQSELIISFKMHRHPKRWVTTAWSTTATNQTKSKNLSMAASKKIVQNIIFKNVI